MGSIVSFRDHPGTTSFWHAGFSQKLEVYRDEWAAVEQDMGLWIIHFPTASLWQNIPRASRDRAPVARPDNAR
ncbi:hypothetical protein DRQ25_06765 [Candidatus Fermentibacteria bacterium]|nr:MAG: hypothetical protein DRQ25_06765 [Candidatus Fermentibacteria bacterium]